MLGSPPPCLAAMMMARLNLLHNLPRLASAAPFLCLIVAQCECPDMAISLVHRVTTHQRRAMRAFTLLACRSLPITHYPSLIAHHSLLITHCSSLIAHHSLLVTILNFRWSSRRLSSI